MYTYVYICRCRCIYICISRPPQTPGSPDRTPASAYGDTPNESRTHTVRPEGPLQVRGETMPGDGLVRVDDIYRAWPEVKATNDQVLGHNGTEAHLNSPRDMTAATDRHATPSATYLGMEGNPPPTPALQTNDTHSAHPTLSASVLAPLQKRIWTPATSPENFIQTPTGE